MLQRSFRGDSLPEPGTSEYDIIHDELVRMVELYA